MLGGCSRDNVTLQRRLTPVTSQQRFQRQSAPQYHGRTRLYSPAGRYRVAPVAPPAVAAASQGDAMSSGRACPLHACPVLPAPPVTMSDGNDSRLPGWSCACSVVRRSLAGRRTSMRDGGTAVKELSAAV